MGILIALLTFILVVNCLFLILLVLVQLPKKEAGAGMAFGAGAGDALFGAGSGNVLTKVTKYSAGIFLVLSMLLAVLNINHHHSKGGADGLGREIEKKAKEAAAAAPAGMPKLQEGGLPGTPTAQTPTTPGTAPVNTNFTITLPTSAAPATASPAAAPQKK
jgi:preprotein translocase subunit SecG